MKSTILIMLAMIVQIGASNGGNISLYIGMKNPESFGRIGAQSSNVQSEISNTFQGSEKLPLELYLDIGKYDIPMLIQFFPFNTGINDRQDPISIP
ncbi:MAG: alpha/beta hydrolase-fold protein [Bacteroidota bacterium]